MKLVISDKKSGKAYNKKADDVAFLNKKVGQVVDLSAVGLPGFKAKITGGSDMQGFPMKHSLEGSGRRKILVGRGVGTRAKRHGMVLRKSVRGNTVGKDISQLNLAITEHGDKPITDFILVEGGKPEDEKASAKDRLIKQSLENVGNVALAEEAKKIKGKAKG